MLRYLALILVLSTPACLAETESGPPTADACPTVECGWYVSPSTNTDTCGADSTFSSQKHFESLDDGASACMVYDTVCVPHGTPAECVPDACRRQFVTCQPTVNPGKP